MTSYFKATKPDGRDFYTGTIDYAAALESGEVVRHPSKRKVRDDASTYVSVSVSGAVRHADAALARGYRGDVGMTAMSLRDALADALITELGHGPNRKNARQLAAAIYDHPAVAAWLREQDEALVALAGTSTIGNFNDAFQRHAAAIAAARERLR